MSHLGFCGFWEALNVKKGGELMGFDMLIIDAKSTTMQGSINVHRLNTFKGCLHTGLIYDIGGVNVTRSNQQFRLCDSNIAVRFTDETTLNELTESVHSIPKEIFKFRNYEELFALANTNTELPVFQSLNPLLAPFVFWNSTIIGEVCTTQWVMAQIRLTVIGLLQYTCTLIVCILYFGCAIAMYSGNTLCLSAFDFLASLLDRKLEITTVIFGH